MGRPKGSQNIKAPAITVDVPRCFACHSTRRSAYGPRDVQEFEGIAPDGKPYNQIVRRRTTCLDCGQTRFDRSHEYEPKRNTQ